ncbi:MAG: hypothetical protein IKL32_03980 [Alphaproteobacteria bacterium]|nr:hypothetical protein [Alphaproteobacteria bacterium]
MIGSIAGGAWLSWMKALVPDNLMGRFFSHRFKWMMIAKIICYGAGAGLIWWFEKYQAENTIFAYSILLGIASGKNIFPYVKSDQVVAFFLHYIKIIFSVSSKAGQRLYIQIR